MSKDAKEFCWTIAIYAGILGLILIPVGGWKWYRAGVQANIYRRQGIEMTQWECFLGMNPAEKVIQIKDEKK